MTLKCEETVVHLIYTEPPINWLWAACNVRRGEAVKKAGEAVRACKSMHGIRAERYPIIGPRREMEHLYHAHSKVAELWAFQTGRLP